MLTVLMQGKPNTLVRIPCKTNDFTDFGSSATSCKNLVHAVMVHAGSVESGKEA